MPTIPTMPSMFSRPPLHLHDSGGMLTSLATWKKETGREMSSFLRSLKEGWFRFSVLMCVNHTMAPLMQTWQHTKRNPRLSANLLCSDGMKLSTFTQLLYIVHVPLHLEVNIVLFLPKYFLCHVYMFYDAVKEVFWSLTSVNYHRVAILFQCHAFRI